MFLIIICFGAVQLISGQSSYTGCHYCDSAFVVPHIVNDLYITICTNFAGSIFFEIHQLVIRCVISKVAPKQ